MPLGASSINGPMKKVRILHVAATSTGGVGLNILLLSRYLNKERFDVSVAMALGSPLDEEFIKDEVKVYHIRMSRKPNRLINLLGLYDLWRLMGSEKFDRVEDDLSLNLEKNGFLTRAPNTKKCLLASSSSRGPFYRGVGLE